MIKSRDAEANIVGSAVTAAHRRLLHAVPALGLTPSHNSGFVVAVRLHDPAGRYLFAWIPNKQHLTFYVRKPALDNRHSLRQTISALGLQTSTNSAGEIKLRIEDEADAARLLAWLETEVPAIS